MIQSPTPRQQFEAQVATLIAKFNQHRAHYLSTAYNETDVRAEFIDPLFEALGWDVSNRAGHGPHEKEVIRERSEISGRSDYQFQLNGRVMFIVEAKAPHVPLDRTDVIMQAKKYAWNSKETSIAAITDFEEFRLYDATVKPDPKHPEVGLIFAAKYTDYLKPKTADELWLLSKEAVAAGSIERLLKMSSVKQRERLPVDVAFLDDLTAWREKLAKAVYKLEPEIDPADLNSVVQVFLDRLIFIRFAEDHGILQKRGLEDVARLWERSGKQRSIVNDLNALFHEVNDLLNGEIFKPHQCEKIEWDAEAALVAKIIQALYDGPYRFDVIGVELLGSIYERYLGKTIRVTATRAMVEDKPEVRKAGGVYYTPKYIVEYIVAQTVGKLIEGKTPAQIAKLKILDPACGSGSFLLGAYQTLIEYHERYYSGKAGKKAPTPALPRRGQGREQNPPPVDALYRRGELEGGQLPLIDAGEGGEYRLPLTEKAAILKNNLFGVDIDPQAVEITMMSLYIKLLEGERGAIMDRHVLPPLQANIKCGNSLIGYDIRELGQTHMSARKRGKGSTRGSTPTTALSDDDLDRIRPFDWHSKSEGFGDIMQAGGFDAVIGNPPYIRIQTLQEWAPIEVEAYKQLYRSAGSGNYDIYVVFVEKGLSLLNKNGRLGFILPHKFFNAKYGEPLRGLIAEGKHLAHVVHFGDRQIFDGATTYTCLMFLDKSGTKELQFTKVDDLEAWRGGGASIEGKVSAKNVTSTEWNFAVGAGMALFEKLSHFSLKLGDVADLFVGLQTDADDVYIVEEIRRSRGRVLCASKSTGEQHWLEDDHLKPFLKGSLNIRRYELSNVIKRLIFPYEMRDGKSVLIEASEYRRRYPLTWAYLESNKERLVARNKGNMGREWYGYVYKKNHTRFNYPKLLVPSIATGSCFAADLEGDFYFVGSGGGGGGGYGIVAKPELGLLPLYLLGLLNSHVLDFYLKQISTPFRGGFLALNRQYIEQLPIRTIDFSDPADKAKHDRMVALVQRMLDLHLRQQQAASSDATRDRLQREINVTDEQIDALVYELYGLTAEEIAIVEGR
jgi:hypothetical protein